MNLGPEGTGLAFTIGGEPVATVTWERGAVTTTADEAMAAERDGVGRPPVKREAASDWLERELSNGVSRPASNIKESAIEAGLAWRTVERVSKQLVTKTPLGFGCGYAWQLKAA